MSLPRTSSGKVQRHACRDGVPGRRRSTSSAAWTRTRRAGRRPRPRPPRTPGRPPAARTRREIAAWLAAQVAGPLGIAPAEVDHRAAVRQLRPRLAPGRRPGRRAGGLARPAALADARLRLSRRSRRSPATSPASRRPAPAGRIAGRPGAGTSRSRSSGSAAGSRAPTGPTAFWRLLRDGVDAVGDVPAGRWADDGTCDGRVDFRARRVPRRRRPVRRRLLRDLAPRGGRDRPAAAAPAGGRLGGAGGRRPGRPSGWPGRRSASSSGSRPTTTAGSAGERGPRRRLRADGQRGEHRGQPALVRLRLPGAEPGGRHGLLVVAGGGRVGT